MSVNRWTRAEKEMLKTMSNEEVASATGRTMAGVQSMRYYLYGTSIFPMKEELDKESQIVKEIRLLNLAKRIGVKLKPKEVER